MPDNRSTDEAKDTTSDIQVTGDPDVWELVCKASSVRQGWMKSTKRMRVRGGWLYLVTTEHRTPHKPGAKPVVVACAEALSFVPAAADYHPPGE